MISQNAEAVPYQAVPYMASMEPSLSIPRELERERERQTVLYHEIIAFVIMLLVPLVVVLVGNCINVQEEYAMQDLREEVMTMTQENAVAKLEVSRLDAPVRIETIAEKKLGMALPIRAVYGATSKQAHTLVGYNGD